MFILQVESTLTAFIIASLIVLLTILVFTKLTKYNDWEEITKGNVANVMRFAIATNDSPLETVIWGLLGMVLLILIYLAFEWLTPRLDVNKEIGSGNTAVGFISMAFSVALSFVIGASIS